jgi:predicted negative regulator of RcsB-dependent stress response
VANKYTRKGRQQTPVGEDEFVSFWERAYEVVKPHTSTIGAGLLAMVVVIAGFWIVTALRDGAREDATEMFGHAVKMYDADLLAADAKPDAEAEGEVKRFKTAEERANAVLAELDALQKKHSLSRVAKEAQLVRAGVLFDLGKYGDAEAAYRKFLDDTSKDDPMRMLAREGIGLSLESRNELDKALAAYKEMEPREGDVMRDRVLFDEARVLAKKGDRAGAEKAYKDILAKSPASTLRDEIQNRLTELSGS